MSKITAYHLNRDGVLYEYVIGQPSSVVHLHRPGGPVTNRFEARSPEGRRLLAEAILGHHFSTWPEVAAIHALARNLEGESADVEEVVLHSAKLAEYAPVAA